MARHSGNRAKRYYIKIKSLIVYNVCIVYDNIMF